jgi:hypothetical protein
MTLKDDQGQKALVARVKSSKTEIDTLSTHILTPICKSVLF